MNAGGYITPPSPERIAEAVLAALARQKQRPLEYEYDVFLSYATADKERAEHIHKAIVAKDLTCFMSEKEVTGGDDFSDLIRDALTNSHEVCLLFSPASAKSEWVLTEWGAAWAFKKRIVSVLYRIDVDSLPERLRKFQAIDLSDLDKYVSEVYDRKPQEEQI